MICCNRTSRKSNSGLQARLQYGLRLWRRTEILRLMNDVIFWELVVLLVLEDANRSILDVTVLVEGNNPLQCSEIGGLHCVANIRTIYFLAACRNLLDRIEDDERAVIGGDRIVVRNR